MRAQIVIAGTLVLAACSNNDARDNTTNVDENLTAENIVSNDVTAIDAVTGDDANMAASAEINDTAPADLNVGDESAPAKSDTKAAPKSAPKKKPSQEPAASTPATSNSSE